MSSPAASSPSSVLRSGRSPRTSRDRATSKEAVPPKKRRAPVAAAPKKPAVKLRPAKATSAALVPVVRTVRVRKRAEKAPAPLRTSQRLRALLADNPETESFTVEAIVKSLGDTSFGTALMFFAIPEVLPIPIPAISALVVLPTAVLSTQMVAGKKQIKLPAYLLKRSVPRKALAAAIFAILPVLERAEKRTKRRLQWATDPAAQRFLGMFIFLLSLAIAVPIPGFNMPQAIAIFVIGLGLVEKDGLVVAAGVLIGLASLVLLGGAIFGLFSIFGFGGW